MPERYAADAWSNVSAGFYSLQFLANLASFFGPYFSGASVCGGVFSSYRYSKNAVTKMQFHNFATSRLPCELW
jgi:hypothetical protein